MLQGICIVCGTKKSRFVKATKGRQGSKFGQGFINNAINSLPFEMHLPGHYFTRPRTKLNK